MTAFEAQINVTNIGIGVAEDGKTLILSLGVGMALPLAQPGSNQPLTAPIGSLTFNLDRDSALQIGQELKDEGEKLSPPSKLEVASSMQQAEQVGSAIGKGMKGIVGGQKS